MAKKKVSIIKPVEQTLIERYRAIQEIGTEIEVPFNVSRMFREANRPISIFGTDISLGEDCCSITDARIAISWYVTQLGGKVTWDT